AGRHPSPPGTFNSITYGGPGAACGSLHTILTPDSGPSGTNVTAEGSDWLDGNSRPGDQICIWWDTVNNIAVACTTLGQDGSWTANFTVPANQSKGQHLVRIDDMDAPLTT